MVKTNETDMVKSECNSPTELIRLAVTSGANLEQLEKLLSLRERYEAGEAQKAYHKAMSLFKANPPKIDKDKTVSFKTQSGTTSYNHATLGNVTEKISTELSKYGLSASWKTQQNGSICVTCRITHEQGHGEETTLCAPSDTSGAKNAIQAIGSTITYLERYTLLALTGLATFEQDDDGQASAPVVEYIDNYQQSQILDYFNELKVKQPEFFKYMKCESLEKMPKTDFQKAMAALEAARAKKAVKK
jgi:hypothetical protein